ncbi:MAG TPA: phage baseplate assembly protein V [Acidimicrobiales bacterium]|nr:phage baseplate assembly protein V [Acidimicrobiales bacterium]
MPQGIDAPLLQIDGRELSDEQLNALVELQLDLGLNVTGRCVMTFTDVGQKLLRQGPFKVGARVVVKLPVADKASAATVECATLEVTGIEVRCGAGADAEQLVVIADDLSHRFSRRTTFVAKQQIKYADLIRTIASTHGVRAAINLNGSVFEYLVVADTDLALLQQIAARTACSWWMEGTTLHVTDQPPTPAVEVKLGDDGGLFSLQVRGRSFAPSSVRVRDWEPKNQKPFEQEAKTPDGVPTSTFAQRFEIGAVSSAFPGQPKQFGQLGVLSPDEAKGLSKALMQTGWDGQVVARGTAAVNPHLAPGSKVKVAGAGDLDGMYPLSSVSHVYRRATGLLTRFVAGERRPHGMVDSLAPAAGYLGGTLNRREGLVVGLVTNNKDPEGAWRVQISCPTLDDQLTTTWARVAAVGAGNDKGIAYLPDINDEVLVGFEGGDLRRPIVLGSLYSGKNKPPVDVGSEPEPAAWRTKSRKGHLIELSDSASSPQQHILLKLGDGNHLVKVAGNEIMIQAPQTSPITVQAGQASVKLSSGNVEISGMNVTIKAETELKLQGLMIQAKAQTAGTVEAGGPLELKGAMVNVNGSGPVVIKGAAVAIN